MREQAASGIARSREEVEEMLAQLEAQPCEPDPLSNAERRRVLLWVLGRGEECEQIEDRSDCLRGIFQ